MRVFERKSCCWPWRRLVSNTSFRITLALAAIGVPLLVAAGTLTGASGRQPTDLAMGPGFLTATSVTALRVKIEPGHPQRTQPELAKGVFLVASRSLRDPNFAQTVVLLLGYERQGAMGVVINRPTELALSRLLPDVETLKDRPEMVYIGGPVAPDTVMLVIRTEDQPEQSEHVVSNLFYSASGLALEQMLHRNGSSEAFRAYAGYAGWAPGQLEGEIARGDWHLLPADEETVFNHEAAAIWPELIRQAAGQWVKIEHSLDFLAVRGAPQLYALFSTIR